MISVIGMAATAVGVLVTVASNWVSEKQMDAKISKKVAEAIAKK